MYHLEGNLIKVRESITNFTVVDNRINVRGKNEMGRFTATGLFDYSTGTATLDKQYGKGIRGTFKLKGELTATETGIQFQGRWSAKGEKGGKIKWNLHRISNHD